MALDYLDVPDSAKTDIGLKHYVKALDSEIADLFLFGWKLTDDGLVHLKALPNLQSLDLMEMQITDAGLVHLKELTNLQSLDLTGCEKITDSGVAELQKALPNCEITY